MVVGPAHSGKTSFLSCLKGNVFEVEKKSTEIAEVTSVEVRRVKKKSNQSGVSRTTLCLVEQSEGDRFQDACERQFKKKAVEQYHQRNGSGTYQHSDTHKRSESVGVSEKEAALLWTDYSEEFSTPMAKRRIREELGASLPTATATDSEVDDDGGRDDDSDDDDDDDENEDDDVGYSDPEVDEDGGRGESVDRLGSLVPLRLSLWDVSGMEQYYALHPLLMSERAVYLVVFNVMTIQLMEETRMLLFWLNSIAAHAPGAVFLLVGTNAAGKMGEAIADNENKIIEVDMHVRKLMKKHALEGKVQESKFTPARCLLTFFPLENSTGEGKEAFMKALRGLVLSQLIVVPLWYLRLYDELMSMRARAIASTSLSKNAACISERKARQIVRELFKLPVEEGENDCVHMLRMMAQAGIVVHYRNHPSLREHVIVEPQWVLNYIKAMTPAGVTNIMYTIGKKGWSTMLKRDLEKYYDTGVASADLLHTLWGHPPPRRKGKKMKKMTAEAAKKHQRKMRREKREKRFIEALMTSLSLMVEVPSLRGSGSGGPNSAPTNVGKYYYVPLMRQDEQLNNKLIAMMPEESKCWTVHYIFDKFMPPSLFAMLSQGMLTDPATLLEEYSLKSVGKTVGMFLLVACGVPFWVTIGDEGGANSILVMIEKDACAQESADKGTDIHNVAVTVMRIVDDAVRRLRRRFVRELPAPKLKVRCEHCSSLYPLLCRSRCCIHCGRRTGRLIWIKGSEESGDEERSEGEGSSLRLHGTEKQERKVMKGGGDEEGLKGSRTVTQSDGGGALKRRRGKNENYYIYFLTANPAGTGDTHSNQFIQEVVDIVHRDVQRPAGAREVKFKVGANAARWKDVLVGLRDFHQRKGKLPEVIHFVCHTEKHDRDYVLRFEDKDITSFQLNALFEELNQFGGVKCVVISACNAEEYVKQVAKEEHHVTGVPIAIGGKAKLDVAKSREWCVGFYHALCRGDEVYTAHRSGLNEVKMQLGVAPPDLSFAYGRQEHKRLVLFPL